MDSSGFIRGNQKVRHGREDILLVAFHLLDSLKVFPGLLKQARKYDIKKPDKEKVKFLPSAKEFRKLFKDGRMWSDPSLASVENGRALFELAVEELVNELESLDSPG